MAVKEHGIELSVSGERNNRRVGKLTIEGKWKFVLVDDGIIIGMLVNWITVL